MQDSHSAGTKLLIVDWVFNPDYLKYLTKVMVAAGYTKGPGEFNFHKVTFLALSEDPGSSWPLEERISQLSQTPARIWLCLGEKVTRRVLTYTRQNMGFIIPKEIGEFEAGKWISLPNRQCEQGSTYRRSLVCSEFPSPENTRKQTEDFQTIVELFTRIYELI